MYPINQALNFSLFSYGSPTYEVSCKNMSLTRIPSNLPNTTRSLYLDNNQIERLQSDAFDVPLPLLNTLSLENNGLWYVAPDAFNSSQTPFLSVIDFDHNELALIPELDSCCWVPCPQSFNLALRKCEIGTFIAFWMWSLVVRWKVHLWSVELISEISL